MPNLEVNMALRCIEQRRITGTAEDGKSYDYYKLTLIDPIEETVYKISQAVVDGKNPPLKGVEYPLIVSIYKDSQDRIRSSVRISKDYIS